jgi:hypothetical protein
VWGDSTTAVLRTDLRRELATALWIIEQRSAGKPPQVVVTGYFNPLSTRVQCADTEGLTSYEKRWLTSQVTSFNRAIQKTTSLFKFAKYTSVSFAGHELCTKDPWVQGRTAGDEGVYHPNQKGQAAYARAVLKSLSLKTSTSKTVN